MKQPTEAERKRSGKGRWIVWGFFMGLIGLLVALVTWEMRTSRIQASLFSRIAARFTFQVDRGPSSAIRFPSHGPYDLRLGYVRIPEWQERLTSGGYTITAQARWSPEMLRCFDAGIFPTYREKTQAGIALYDRSGLPILQSRFPQRVYGRYESIPPILSRMLPYIENRDLFATGSPYRNPAIEWKRQGRALIDAVIRLFDAEHDVVGGSTLATQIEKFRHSPQGLTLDAREKLRQILSASLRAYRWSERTAPARTSILLDYINSIPLAAVPGNGEVIGLGDGLRAWYGKDFETVNRTLRDLDTAPFQVDPQAGTAVRATLSLFLAHRRPSAYLLTSREALEDLTNIYLEQMTRDGVISPAIRDAATAAELSFVSEPEIGHRLDPSRRKAATLIRSRLLAHLGLAQVYDLDRIDLDVKTPMDLDLQTTATHTLLGLRDRAQVEKAGLVGPHMLEKGDPAQVVHSFSLFETRPEGNLLRVQTNTFDGPFIIDEQTKLDLGSSAKLRTLVHYLEIIADLHRVAAGMGKEELARAAAQDAPDPLTRWAMGYVRDHPGWDLASMLAAAMDRRYSASPAERFFTGGGLHTFSNFNRADNQRILSVRQAFEHSVNLVFVRLMRDIVHYHIFQRYGTTPRALERIDEAEKRRLLRVFADREGIVFVCRFFEQYRRKPPSEARKQVFDAVRRRPAALAAVFRFVDPAATVDPFAAFLGERLPNSRLTDAFLRKLYTEYGPGEFSLADIGYIANIHPLQLWVVRYLQEVPQADIRQTIEASRDVRQDVYQWLFKTRHRRVQLQRIRTIIELEAFQDIHQAWQRLGYPFDYLIPSYATTLGSSADRPGALAELSGILLNDGVRKPMVRIQTLHFARGTPYETVLERTATEGERVLPVEVARTVKAAMLDVVSNGTARRLQRGVVLPGGRVIPIGGKTGTGDHRYKTFGPGGILIGEKVVNRTATFVFFIGDRFFGTITAHVAGPHAAEYSFSSSLPVQVLSTMLPDLEHLFETPDEGAQGLPGP